MKSKQNCYHIGKGCVDMDYVNCKLCPRQCGADRTSGETGFCGCPDTALVAKTMLHKWEEPALAGNGGSGAVFFGGCTLKCCYCQNAAISCGAVGQSMDSRQLRAVFETLIAQGAENIDLVTPTHFLPTVLPALSPKLPVPVVYNCGGYERVETLRELEGKSDRSARFVCVIAIAINGEIIETFEGVMEGTIIEAPRGENGFGYDPIFVPQGENRTFAEMSQEEKNRISHRAKALKKALDFIEDEMSVLDDEF